MFTHRLLVNSQFIVSSFFFFSVPLVKDTYASERRKAKVLNFSIAYGKTVHGLAQDWGITKEEAEETLNAWYSDRPEVREWQLKTQALARKSGFVLTMMGRYRRLPDATSNNSSATGHAMRAAINTPIQGSAADVVMMAMIKLWKSQVPLLRVCSHYILYSSSSDYGLLGVEGSGLEIAFANP